MGAIGCLSGRGLATWAGADDVGAEKKEPSAGVGSASQNLDLKKPSIPLQQSIFLFSTQLSPIRSSFLLP